MARDLRVPIFLPRDSTPVAVLDVSRIRVDYAVHGFFRIGLLPQLLIEGVTLQVRNPDRIHELLVRLRTETVTRLEDKPVRVVKVCLRADYEGRRVLVAEQLTEIGGNNWVFRDGSCCLGDGSFIRFENATLAVDGPEFGRLILRTGSEISHFQFLLNQDLDSIRTQTRSQPCVP